MKRIWAPIPPLIAAAGLIAGAVTAQAQVAGSRPSIGVHGFFNTVMGITGNQDQTDTPAADVNIDAEIHFDGTARLDSGLSIRTHIELEGLTDDDQIDEAYVVLRGGFGQLTLGLENGAAEMMTVGFGGNSASVGAHYYFDTADFIRERDWVSETTTTGVAEYQTDGDNEKITYYTPRFYGVQIGASYIPEFNGQENIRTNASSNDRYRDSFSVGANYQADFGRLAVGFGVGYLAATQTGDFGSTKSDWNEYSVAGRFDIGSLRLAAGFRAIVDGADYGSGLSAEGRALSVGMRYMMGANAVSLNLVTANSEGRMDNAALDESGYFKFSAARKLGTGVTGHLNVATVDWRGEDSNDADDNAGWTFMAGLNVGF